MKRFVPVCLLACGLLTGCLTAEDKAAKQAFDSRPQLGVTFVPEWDTENLVVLQGVPAGSPAAQAGLQPRDVITSLNGQKVTDIHSLNDIEASMQHGQTINVGILRNQKPMVLVATLS